MTVGIVGAGQLGRMLALAGYPLGLDFLFLDKDGDTPGAQVAPTLTGSFTDARLIGELARRCEVVSFDWENVSVDALQPFDDGTRFAPPLAALAVSQDRLLEKQLFTQLKIPTTRFVPVDSAAALAAAVGRIGLPGMLKTRRMGYDGKGQAVVRTAADIAHAWNAIGNVPAIYEERVPFDYEVSVIGVRSRSGEVVVYPLNRNEHADGILRVTRSPLVHPRLGRQAGIFLRRVLKHFSYVGVLTIEFFVRRGRLIANEIARACTIRGTGTIEGAVTSQFENHLRAILGLPLGDPSARGHCAMLNLIGTMPDRQALLGQRGVFLHDYGKSPRPGRKLGHLTVVTSNPAQREARVKALKSLIQ